MVWVLAAKRTKIGDGSCKSKMKKVYWVVDSVNIISEIEREYVDIILEIEREHVVLYQILKEKELEISLLSIILYRYKKV